MTPPDKQVQTQLIRIRWWRLGIGSLAAALLALIIAPGLFENVALAHGNSLARGVAAAYPPTSREIQRIALSADTPSLSGWVGPLQSLDQILSGVSEKPEIKRALSQGVASFSAHPEGPFSLQILAAARQSPSSARAEDNPIVARVLLVYPGYGWFLALVFFGSGICSLLLGLFLSSSLQHATQKDFALAQSKLLQNFRRQEESLQATLDRTVNQLHSLQLMLGSMNEGVVVVDTRGRIRLLNPKAKAFFDLEQLEDGQIVQSPLLERIHASELFVLFEAIMANHNAAEMELVLYRQIISTLHVSASWIPSADPAEQGVLFVITDISTLKHLESVRTEFVANVSHELRTPVTALKGFAETLLDSPLDDPATERHFLGIILRQAERLMAIIEDLLMLSRLEQSGGTIPKESCSLMGLMEAALEVCRPSAQVKSSLIICDFGEMTITANRHLLEQAIINLVENGIKYSPPGSEIRIGARALVSPKGWQITVQDNGPGSPLRDQAHLFERFYRIDKARSRNMGGTGLGLAIVRHIALVHGGTVSLESTIGQGSRFTLALPDFS